MYSFVTNLDFTVKDKNIRHTDSLNKGVFWLLGLGVPSLSFFPLLSFCLDHVSGNQAFLLC